MNDIVKGVLIAVITSIVVGLGGYVFLVKENQIKIDSIAKELSSIDQKIEASGSNINAIKLFVVSAHPDKNYLPIASAKKLQALQPNEIFALASGIEQEDLPSSMVKTAGFKQVIEEHNFTPEDIANITEVLKSTDLKNH